MSPFQTFTSGGLYTLRDGEELELYDSTQFDNVLRTMTAIEILVYRGEVMGQGYHFADSSNRMVFVLYDDAQKLQIKPRSRLGV